VEDAVIGGTMHTLLGKARKGSLRAMRPKAFAAVAIREAVARARVGAIAR